MPAGSVLDEQQKKIITRFEEIESRLLDPAIIVKREEFISLSKERARLSPTVQAMQKQEKLINQLGEIEYSESQETDEELKMLLEKEKISIKDKIGHIKEKIQLMLLPKNESSGKNVFVEIRAGTGGDEAALFARDILRMYSRFLENEKINFEITEVQNTGLYGVKEAIILVKGERAYDLMHLEAGGHRVQRIPETESGGRIHTSACTVAVIPEVQESELQINQLDLRIDVFRSSGPGGQSVNTTDSAVRIIHIPSKITVSCQDEKSQHKNKAKAMSILRARLKDKELEKKYEKTAKEKKAQIGSGDRSEKIRTYNFLQNRVTDHRINYTSHRLDKVMEGDLNDLIHNLLESERVARLDSFR